MGVPLGPPKNAAREGLLAQLRVVSAQQSRVQVAKAAAGLAQANRSTEPTLGLRGGREDSESLIGLSLSIPLMVRSNFSDEVKAASSDVIQQEQILMDIHRRASARFDGSLERFGLIHGAWGNWKDGDAALLTQQMQLLQDIWKAGEISTSEFLLQAGQDFIDIVAVDFDPGCSTYIKKAREYIEKKSAAFEKVSEGLGYKKHQYTSPDIDFFTDELPSLIQSRNVAA